MRRAPCAGPVTAWRWTPPRPRSCSARAGTTSSTCARRRRRVRDQGLADAGRPGVVTYSRKVFIPLTRLCRDRCHYCTFATTPNRVRRAVPVAGRGAGDRDRRARPGLQGGAVHPRRPARGALARGPRVARRARLRLHARLRPRHGDPGARADRPAAAPEPRRHVLGRVAAPQAGGAVDGHDARDDLAGGCSRPARRHFGSPDKDPAVRLRVLEDAGRSNVPFTTGILIGIGETLGRPGRVVVRHPPGRPGLRRHPGSHRPELPRQARHGDGPACPTPSSRNSPRPSPSRGSCWARGCASRPRRTSSATSTRLLSRAGIDDWGGVSPLTPDHVNPERPWPQIEELAAHSAEPASASSSGSPSTPSSCSAGEPWLDPRLMPHVARARAARRARPRGRRAPGPAVAGTGGREPGRGSAGRIDLHTAIDTEGRTTDRRADFDSVYGDWGTVRRGRRRTGAVQRFDSRRRRRAAARRGRPGRVCPTRTRWRCCTPTAPSSTPLAALADDLRADVVGDDVTYVVNRNINFTNVCYTGCRFCAFAQRRTDADAYTLSMDEVGRRAEEAWELGATEVCMQGGIHPDLPGTAYFDIARAVKERVPGMHVHAFSPMEVVNGAARTGLSVRDWLTAAKEAGLDSIPGTAAEILDDDVRWVLTKGKLPAVGVDRGHHHRARGRPAVELDDDVRPRRQPVALGRALPHPGPRSRTGPAASPSSSRCRSSTPTRRSTSPAWPGPGPTVRENRAVHAMARILLHGRIDNIQCSWVKLGVDGCRAGAARRRQRPRRHADGGDDQPHGRQPARLGQDRRRSWTRSSTACPAARARQRMTDYGVVPAERLAAAAAFTGTLPSLASARLTLQPVLALERQVQRERDEDDRQRR